MPRFLAGASVAGDGLQERLRSATFALAGLATAVGLVLVGIAYNQGWPEFVDSPLPDMRVERLGEATIVGEPARPAAVAGRAEARSGAEPQAATGSSRGRSSGPGAPGRHQDDTATGGVTPPVAPPPPAGGGEAPSPSPGSPSPVPAAPSEPPAPAPSQPAPGPSSSPSVQPPTAQPPTSAPPASPPPAASNPGKGNAKGHEKSHGRPPVAPVAPPPPAPTTTSPESPPPTSGGPGNGNGKANGHDK